MKSFRVQGRQLYMYKTNTFFSEYNKCTSLCVKHPVCAFIRGIEWYTIKSKQYASYRSIIRSPTRINTSLFGLSPSTYLKCKIPHKEIETLNI